MADLSKMTDVEVIQYYFKTDEETAQKLIDEGMDMDVMRGNIKPFQENFVGEIDNITNKLKEELQKAVTDFDPSDPRPQ